jgi:arginine decarboxylase-like protein
LRGQLCISVRDETRQAAAELMPQIIKRIEKAIKNSEVFPDTGDELIGMVKNNIYLIELSFMQSAGDGGGVRELQPAALRLVGGR